MTINLKTITRKALYDRVWAQPIRTLAPELNLSDVGLAKLCDRHNIPRPQPGHWLRVQHGQPLKKPVLPEAKSRAEEVIELPHTKQGLASVSDSPEIPVSTKTRSHPLVVQCREDFKGAATNEYGRLVSKERQDVDVSRVQFRRALSLINTILRSVEGAGYSARYSETYREIELVVDEACIRLLLKEPAQRSQRELTEPEKREKKVQELKGWGWYFPNRWHYAPTGKLTLQLSGMGLYGIRRSWSDSKRATLEERLPEILGGILLASEHLQQQRRNDEAQARRWVIQDRRRRRVEKARELFEQRVEAVDQLAVRHRKANDIRMLLQAMKDSGAAEQLPVSDRRLLQWADDLARHYDPCCGFEFEGYTESIVATK